MSESRRDQYRELVKDKDARIRSLEEACRILGEEVRRIAENTHKAGSVIPFRLAYVVSLDVLAHPEASKYVRETT